MKLSYQSISLMMHCTKHGVNHNLSWLSDLSCSLIFSCSFLASKTLKKIKCPFNVIIKRIIYFSSDSGAHYICP